ncbi:MAG: DUF4240 domain-containing protein [Verrucomicrobiaceae bacterium]|nr:MAG: DUF4240 domain-containing protein [Verrucomicrobiaceae bacterium]
MTTDEFWQIIDAVHRGSGGDMERKCELLKLRLEELDDAELSRFSRHFAEADAGAYTWPLWGAAYVMNGGCSDDAFSDFRATLISQGRAVYERALADPDSLVEVDFGGEEDICYEGFQYVPNTVAEEKGIELAQPSPFPADPAEEPWDEEELDTLYPRLTAKYAGSADTRDDGNSPAAAKPWWKVW